MPPESEINPELDAEFRALAQQDDDSFIPDVSEKLTVTTDKPKLVDQALRDAGRPAEIDQDADDFLRGLSEAPDEPEEPKPTAAVAEDKPPVVLPEMRIPAKDSPPVAVPWYKSLGRGAAHTATLGWGDEAVGRISEMLPQPEDPEGYSREYKAGSQAEDMTRTERLETQQAREARPGAFFAGEALGAAPAAVAGGLAVPGVAGAVGTGAATGAAMGAGSAESGDRLKNAAEGAAVGGLTAGALHGAAQGLQSIAKGAKPLADRLMTQVFMQPEQRAALQARKGPEALEQLGADAREAGLFKRQSWLDYFRPVTARRVANNAARVMEESGQGIKDFESNLTASGVNPEVKVKPITDKLRSAATDIENVPDLDAGKTAKTFRKQAELFDQPSTAEVEGHVANPPPLRKAQVEPRLPGEPVVLDGAEPNTTPLNPAQAQIQREFMPLNEAIEAKRFLQERVNWQKRPNALPQSYGTEQARKAAWGGLKDEIRTTLENDPNVDKSALLEYFKNNKNFSTAASAFDPAMRLAERNSQAGLGLTDMAASAVVGGGPTGGLAAMAHRAGAGMAPASAATAVKIGGFAAKQGGRLTQAGEKVAPTMLSNDDMKKQVWYRQLKKK